MPETPLLAVRCPIDVLNQIESEKNLTGRSKTDVVIDRLRNSIPSLAVTDRHKLPAIAAIYQVFTSDNNLLYIGITDNLKQDWESHPLYGQFLESDVNSRITWYNSDLPVIDPNLVKKYNSVSDTVNTDRDSHSENMVSSDQIEYAIANSEIIKGIQSRLETMEQLLKLQREALIASPFPNQETVETDSTVEPVRPATAIEDSQKKILETVKGSESLDTLPVPTDEPGEDEGEGAIETIKETDSTVEDADSVEPDSTLETVTDAIETVGMSAKAAVQYLEQKKVKVSYDSLNRWINEKIIPDTSLGKKVQQYLTLRDGLYFPKTD